MTEPASRGTVTQLPGTKPSEASSGARAAFAPDDRGPKAPDFLSPTGRSLWRRFVPAIEDAAPGWLKSVDAVALGFALEHAAIAVTALRRMRGAGGHYEVIVTDSAHAGRLAKHPAAQVFRDNARAYLDALASLGLSPRVRAALDLGAIGRDGDDDDDTDAWD